MKLRMMFSSRADYLNKMSRDTENNILYHDEYKRG